MKTRIIFYCSAFIVLACIFVLAPSSRTLLGRLSRKNFTVSDRLKDFGPRARDKLSPLFERAGVSYPPKKVVLVVIKDERKLQVYAEDTAGKWRFIRDYPVLAASGELGPKLQEGDLQVPEGLYRVESLNPNSQFYVSLRVNYPNDIDRRYAALENRTNLGGDIMIHGSMVSVGCVAIGDNAIEEIFSLAADTGLKGVSLILTPVDFRKTVDPSKLPSSPPWLDEVYGTIQRRLRDLPRQGI